MKQTATLRTLVIAVCAAGLMQACVPLVVAGVGAGVTSTLDRRTYGEQLMDREIENRFTRNFPDALDEKTAISATAFNRWLLLTGQAIDPPSREEAERIARAVPNVREVYNEVAIGYPANFSARSNDTYISSKVKARLFDSPYVSGHHVKVVTDAAIVYLMGEVTESEAAAAVDVARNTSGVKKVVSVFEIITPERAKQLSVSVQTSSSEPASSD